MFPAADTAWIIERAKAIGFDLCGVARAEKFPELEQFEEWLERGYAGQMRYLEDGRRQNPTAVMGGVRSIIVCALNYNGAYPYSTEAAAGGPTLGDSPQGWISRYAWGDDYHKVMWTRLNALEAALFGKFSLPFQSLVYADTGPIAERIAAKYAGLGWLGKNTLLLNERFGSWLFLGVILTSLDLTPSIAAGEAPPADLCGNCRQCLDACPTGALAEPYLLDARRCISYLTIELRGVIPAELREGIGWHVYGCDICQDVCPFNRHAPVTTVRSFEPRGIPGVKGLMQPSLEWLANMEEQEFREVFRGSAIKRTKWKGLVRNACIALGNACSEKRDAAKARIVSVPFPAQREPGSWHSGICPMGAVAHPRKAVLMPAGWSGADELSVMGA
jgi:epoxyqueuosine reductase